MHSGKDGLPSAPLMDHQAVAMAVPPPTYDETMGLVGGYPPQPQYPPGPQYPPQPPYPVEPQHPPHVPYPPQPYYGGPGFATPQGHTQPLSPAPVPLQNVTVSPGNVHHVPLGSVVIGPQPVALVCPACRLNVKTTTITENKTQAHLTCLLLCILGCCCFSCIPYCMDSCKKVRHTCPNCGNYMGTYSG